MVRILGLCQGDPNSRSSYSGSARQCFRAVGRIGALHATVDASIGQPLQHVLRALASVRARRIRGSHLLGAWSPASVRARSRRAADLARRARD